MDGSLKSRTVIEKRRGRRVTEGVGGRTHTNREEEIRDVDWREEDVVFFRRSVKRRACASWIP